VLQIHSVNTDASVVAPLFDPLGRLGTPQRFGQNVHNFLIMSCTVFSEPPLPSSSPLDSSATVVMIMLRYFMLVLNWNVMSAFECMPKISGGSWSGSWRIYSIQLPKLSVSLVLGRY